MISKLNGMTWTQKVHHIYEIMQSVLEYFICLSGVVFSPSTCTGTSYYTVEEYPFCKESILDEKSLVKSSSHEFMTSSTSIEELCQSNCNPLFIVYDRLD